MAFDLRLARNKLTATIFVVRVSWNRSMVLTRDSVVRYDGVCGCLKRKKGECSHG